MALRLVLLVFLSSLSPALGASNSFDLWANATLNIKRDKLLYHFMTNPRLNDNWTRFDKQFIRNALGYEIKPGLSIMLGHDWFFINSTTSGVDYENRIWQQIQIINHHGKLTSLNRLRMEERFLESDFIASLRWLLRVEYPIPKLSSFNFVVSNEIFVNLNKDFDYAENRSFVGLNKRFTENMNLDLGYQLSHIDQRIDNFSHALLVNLVYNMDL